MRPSAWVSLLAVFLLTGAVCNNLTKAQARSAIPPKPKPEALPSWVVAGDWMTTSQEAVDDAMEKARAKLTEYLRAQDPPMEWDPDRAYIQQKLWQNLDSSDEALKAFNDEQLQANDVKSVAVNGHAVQVVTRSFDGLGEMRRAAVRVTVNAFARNEFDTQDQLYRVKQRQDRAAGRQGLLARVLAGLVALLAAVACYLRLEDATKGYYTTLLRVAAVGFVALVGAGIWLLT
jgi:hypothetical protein